MLDERLRTAGFRDEHVTLLTGTAKDANRRATSANFLKQLAALRDEAGGDDVIVVVVASYLRTVNGRTYICVSDSNPAELTGEKAGSQPKTFISLSQVVETLEGSAATKRVVLIDSAEEAGETSESASSPKAVPLPPELWTITSTSGALWKDAQGQPHTWFMQSLLDGLTSHADSNSDGSVSLFELNEYLQGYAELGDFALPAVGGKTNRDFELATPSSDLHAMQTLRPELQTQIVDRLVESANYELFQVRNPASALKGLRRALSYQLSPERRTEIENLSNTALAAQGDVIDAWKRAAKKSQVLQLYAPKPLVITVPFQTTGRQIPPGTYITIDGVSDDSKWLWVSGALKADSSDGRIRFTKIPIEKGWLDVRTLDTGLKGTPKSAVRGIDRSRQSGAQSHVAER